MKTIDQHTLSVLSGLVIDGRVVRITQDLDRPDYLAVNKVLKALGGSWNRKQKGHLFDSDPTDLIDQAILSGCYSNPTQEFDCFFTPPVLATWIAELSGVRDDDRVLEPSAGQGALIAAVLGQAPDAYVCAFEILETNHARLTKRFSNNPNVVCTCADFTRWPPAEPSGRWFTKVVMNPPFSRQQDIVHVMRAFEWLKIRGRLVAVMSAGVLFRTDQRTKNFLEFVSLHSGTITKLPPGSFKQAGTMVNTVLVVVDK